MLRMVVGIEIQVAVGVYGFSVNRNDDRSTTEQQDKMMDRSPFLFTENPHTPQCFLNKNTSVQ